MEFDRLVESILLLEQPHMNFDVEGYEVLFDPELERKSYQEGVGMFRRLLAGDRVHGKYNSVIQLPSGKESSFVRALVKDIPSMNFIKLWLSSVGRKEGQPYTLKQFFNDSGLYSYLAVRESVLQEKKYRVTHYGLGISDTTEVDIPDENKAKSKAKQNVFFRLKSQGKISSTDAYRWKEASAKEIKPF